MRGDGITIRGFGADTGDIYRDGIRESGQVRRSTANIERIEILKYLLRFYIVVLAAGL